MYWVSHMLLAEKKRRKKRKRKEKKKEESSSRRKRRRRRSKWRKKERAFMTFVINGTRMPSLTTIFQTTLTFSFTAKLNYLEFNTTVVYAHYILHTARQKVNRKLENMFD